MGGDLNKDSMDIITGIHPFQQVVDKATRKGSCLDKLITDLPCTKCDIVPPLRSNDDEVESDHDIAICLLYPQLAERDGSQ